MSSKHLSRTFSFSKNNKAFPSPRIRPYGPRQVRSYASESADKSNLRPLVLEKPDKFRPPSHPSRKPAPRRSFGPRLTDEEIAAQKTKQYPSMMPPEGSFKYALLTARRFHAWFATSILVALAGATFYIDFHSKNKYPDLLPPASLLWSHPIEYMSQYAQVYKMHKQEEAAENLKKRQRKQDEVRKRREYMRAHGIEHEGPYGLGTVEGDEYRKKMEEEREHLSLEEQAREELVRSLRAQRAREQEILDADEVRGFDGERRKVKKWFGIW
ncbi:uncharacterized protein PV09_02472 [Verruconis gallopava]|uniref:Transmembrane protein n=1 Tax=Verruconis gallopava TaxID=253628 RepID=A0A0D1Z1H6_9PEZI|nr:uncharacterized protein PV09_02472 [Verruconis gallopava]KIW06792.1 hypothetical protein PV09_02472 [Verruconis gallopava]